MAAHSARRTRIKADCGHRRAFSPTTGSSSSSTRKLLDSAFCPDGCADGSCQQAGTPGGLKCGQCKNNLLVDQATGKCGECTCSSRPCSQANSSHSRCCVLHQRSKSDQCCSPYCSLHLCPCSVPTRHVFRGQGEVPGLPQGLMVSVCDLFQCQPPTRAAVPSRHDDAWQEERLCEELR